MSSPRVRVVPCLSDNYAYLVVCPDTGCAAVVDPSEAVPVIAAIEAEGVSPTLVLATHHHYDHTGGIEGLCARWPSLEVVGHASDRGRIPRQSRFVAEGETVEVGRLRAAVRHIPGHTLGAVAYDFGDDVFTGDTLFAAGCGRLFEGTPAMMFASLTALRSGVSPTARIWCGHEYTVKNLRFASMMEPENADVAARLAWAESERAASRSTVPSPLSVELRTNPFLRATDVARFTELRRLRDGF